jgi:hypothetical protein
MAMPPTSPVSLRLQRGRWATCKKLSEKGMKKGVEPVD